MNSREERWIWLDYVRERVRDRDLGSSAGHVALVLVVHYMNGKAIAWPSQPELASATGLSEATVRRVLKELERYGLQRRRGHPSRTSGHVYTLDLNPVTMTGFDLARANHKLERGRERKSVTA